jgi:putative ABC transport system ATP-binding protein
MKGIISTKGVHKVYRETKVPVYAVNGIDVTFEEGEFTCIVGPSGSGKTTLLNMIGGLDEPTKGTIQINGTEVTGLSRKKLTDFRLHHIGFVFQSYNLIPVLTALENVEFIMQLQGVKKRDRRKRAVELLEAVGLGDRINDRPGDLSGGQQQRVSVARALASKPRFILADEPTANLDSKSTSELLDLMMEMNDKYKTTFIFSTHDQRVVDKARRIVTIDDGKITEDKDVA